MVEGGGEEVDAIRTVSKPERQLEGISTFWLYGPPARPKDH